MEIGWMMVNGETRQSGSIIRESEILNLFGEKSWKLFCDLP